MPESNEQRVRAIYDAFGRGDVDAVLGAMMPDVEWHEAEGLPYGGLHRGPGVVAEKVFGPLMRDVPDFSVTPEEVVASGDTVHVVCRYRGTGRATGRSLDLGVVHVWDLRDGRVARFRQFIDTVKFREVVPEHHPAAA